MNRNDKLINDEILSESIQSDVLKRNNKLIVLSKLLSNLKNNTIISVDGRWGTGKTYFVKQFKYLVDNIKNYKDNKILNENDKLYFNELHDSNLIVYYNAWENDMHSNALESLIYNILNEYPKFKNQVADFKDFKELFKSFARDILYAASLNAFDLNSFDKLNSFEDLAKGIITIEEKKNAFNKLVDMVLGDKNRLILIIDELDRCKPSFAVEILETIKHFYNNDKITIIVSTNNYELSNTIKNYYGSNFDGYGYLNKIYDYTIYLDSRDIKTYLQKQLNFCRQTWVYHDFSYLVMDYFNFTFRECNKFITLYTALKNYIEIEKTFEEQNYIHTCIFVPIALALKIKNIKKYDDFINKKGESIIKEFLSKKIDGTKYEGWIKELIRIKESDNYKDKIIELYNDIFSEEYNYYRYPFMDVISMLGMDININNN